MPEDAKILAYDLNEIVAEKVIALVDRARNEPRDLYDIWYLTANKYVNLTELVEPVAIKAKFRGKESTGFREKFIGKKARLKRLWGIRLASQMTVLPEFEQVYRTVLRELRKAGF